MPIAFLTPADRQRLDQFPAEIPPADLATYFTLTAADRDLLLGLRGATSRLGVALQLAALRYLGFCPLPLTDTPAPLLAYLAAQLRLDPAAFAGYGDRAQTRSDHFQLVQTHLGFREATPEDWHSLAVWLRTRALEHDKPTLLLQLAAEKLRADRVVRPGLTRLERLVASAREWAEAETFRRLAALLDEPRCQLLDALLVLDPAVHSTRLDWLRQEATSVSAQAIQDTLARHAYLRDLGVPAWLLSGLTPNRRKFLAQIGRKSTAQTLSRARPARRYPILLALLVQLLEDGTDQALDLYDQYFGEVYSRAGRDLAEFRQRHARATNEKLHLLEQVGGVVLDPQVADAQVRPRIYGQVPEPEFRTAVAECARLRRPLDDNYFDLLAERYSTIRTFAPAFLAAFTFQAHPSAQSLVQALTLLRELNAGGRRKVPDSAPMGFVPARWHSYLGDAKGGIDRRYYELCALWELRTALRSGHIWVVGSRRYADPATYLLPKEDWPAMRAEVCALLGTGVDGAARLQELQTELTAALGRLETALGGQAAVRLEEGELVLTPLAALELPESAKQLAAAVSARLPRVELVDLVVEVDGWLGWSRHLTHAAGQESRPADLPPYLYGAILAQACNFGLTAMATVADLSHWRLAWATTWYLREETLRAAVNEVVNHQHRQPISGLWGGGTLSSSDGQRFPIAIPTRTATALPRYFGYGRGLTYYTWTSDQFSQYGTRVIPSTVRDSTYVLDAILDNETELPIAEHTTDTNGFTEIVFALFDLLKLEFAPRIRDLPDQRLYRIEPVEDYPLMGPLLKGTINQALIVEHWDDLLRLAGSLKLGWVTASLLIGKLQALPRQNILTRALQEYGRLIKTLFILRYLESEPYRRRIEGQLNKGEALHALRRFLFFAHLGQLRRHRTEAHTNQASCLNLVANAVIAWNTIYMAAVLDQLKAEGYEVRDEDVKHLSPARYEHINPHGKYHFHIEEELNRAELRPLRRPE